MKRLLFALLMLSALAAPLSFVVGAAFAAPVEGTFPDPAVETRARALQRQFRCLVCQGQSIDESASEFSADLRHLVRQQIATGQSDQQIKDFLLRRYGPFILMQPPVQPNTYFLWLAPFLVLVGAGGVAFWVISRARKLPISPD